MHRHLQISRTEALHIVSIQLFLRRQPILLPGRSHLLQRQENRGHVGPYAWLNLLVKPPYQIPVETSDAHHHFPVFHHLPADWLSHHHGHPLSLVSLSKGQPRYLVVCVSRHFPHYQSGQYNSVQEHDVHDEIRVSSDQAGTVYLHGKKNNGMCVSEYGCHAPAGILHY